MRIASVEQVELGNIMELSITCHVLKQARQSHLSGEASLSKADGRNTKSRSRSTVARPLREKIHTSMLVVTLREGEERGICSAALKELVKFIKDQAEQRCVVVFVLNKESAIWKDSRFKTLLRGVQLNYIDVEGVRLVTHDRCIAGDTTSDDV